MASPNQFVLRTPDGREYPIENVVKVGRDDTNTIPLNDLSASRHHASFWVEATKLYIRDEQSANGVFVNDKRISTSQPQALRNGDRVRIGKTDLTVALLRATSSGTVILPAVASPNNNRWPLVACASLLILGLAVLCSVPLVGYYAFGWSIPQLSGLLPSGATAVAQSTAVNANAIHLSTPPPPIAARQYADKSQGLAHSVAALNDSEIKFIKHVNQNPSSSLTLFGGLASPILPADLTFDSELAEIAANALQVCTTADDLSHTAVAQDGASANAAQIASQYVSMAQLSCALVIDSQNMRQGLSAGTLTPPVAAATIADYGARLWNPSVTDAASGNPFTPHLSNPVAIPVAQFATTNEITSLLGAPNDLTWTAVSAQQDTKTLTLSTTSLSAPPIDRYDSALLAKLTTAQGQSADPQSATQMAAAIIRSGGGASNAGNQPVNGGEVQATFWSASAVSANNTQSPVNTLPTFPGGQANAVTVDANTEPFTALLTIDADNKATVQSQSPVKDVSNAMTLGISNVVIKQIQQQTGFTEAKVTLDFDVSWQTSIVSPQIPISCNSQGATTATTATGSTHVSVTYNLILYPGNAYISCSAGTWGRGLGSVEASILVGDPIAATQRVERVETQYYQSGLTSAAQNDAQLKTEAAGVAATQGGLQTQNALSTEVIGTQTAEFVATITQIARQTLHAPTPAPTETPLPTATFTPTLVDTFFHAGDAFGVASHVITQPGRLYRVCLSGTVNLTTGPAKPSDLEHVNGIAVPANGCLVIEGNGKTIDITCGSGEAAEDPGGFTVQVFDLGPS